MNDETFLYLGIRQTEACGQLSSIRLGDVFLDLEPFLQAFPLKVGEDSSGPRLLTLAAAE